MSTMMSRRAATQAILGGASTLAAGLLTSTPAGADPNVPSQVTGMANPDLAPFDNLISEFLHKHELPGAALAVTRHSRLVYARGFGLADVELKRPVQPASQFRLASISKPLTAIAVMQLVEQSKFQLDDRVFDILPAGDWLPEKHDPRLSSITIRHLLQHTAGWDREKSFDPIGRVNEIAQFVGKPLPAGPADVIRYTLSLPLDFDPGSRYAYYNVDYLLLGRLIEHAAKQPYETYVKQHVLEPMGVTGMHLGRAWKEDLGPDEVRYYDSGHRENIAINGSRLGDKVPQVYGPENIEAYEAHGGWVGSAIDLVRFASAFDDPAKSKLLKAESITAMWARPAGAAGHEDNGTPKDSYYGCGWMVRSVEGGLINTFHSGLIAGTSTLLVRRHDGLNWAVLFNCDANSKGERPSKLVDPLVHQAADAVKKWPDKQISL